MPLVFGTLLFGAKELAAQGARLTPGRNSSPACTSRRWCRRSPVPSPSSPARLLLFSGATPAIDERLAFLDRVLPLAVLEVSHLAGSVVGLGLLVLSRALFRRVQTAYHISVWLLSAGIVASLLKGLDFEEAALLALVLGVLMLGRRAFYRPTAILAERFTPAWVVKHHRRHRHRGVDRDHLLSPPRATRTSCGGPSLSMATRRACCAPRWRSSCSAPRMCLWNMLRPARPEPAVAGPEELERARALIAGADLTLANAALTGDKRLLFSDAGDAFVMYQIAGHSWVALGDPGGLAVGRRGLVWRLREISDHHGGQTVFYQIAADHLGLYVDSGTGGA